MAAIALHPQDQRVIPIDGSRFLVLTEVYNPAANTGGGNGYTVTLPISASVSAIMNINGATAPDNGGLSGASATTRNQVITFGASTAGTPGRVMIVTLHNSPEP